MTRLQTPTNHLKVGQRVCAMENVGEKERRVTRVTKRKKKRASTSAFG